MKPYRQLWRFGTGHGLRVRHPVTTPPVIPTPPAPPPPPYNHTPDKCTRLIVVVKSSVVASSSLSPCLSCGRRAEMRRHPPPPPPPPLPTPTYPPRPPSSPPRGAQPRTQHLSAFHRGNHRPALLDVTAIAISPPPLPTPLFTAHQTREVWRDVALTDALNFRSIVINKEYKLLQVITCHW